MLANFFFRCPRAPGGVAASGVSASIQFGGPTCSIYQYANLYYLLTGELPSEERLHHLLPHRSLSSASVASLSKWHSMLKYADAAAVCAAGLRPFSETAVIRVEHTPGMTMMELGSSTTYTVFGCFLPEDENQSSDSGDVCAKDTAGLYKAGTVLNVHLGFPGSCGSRYYILLDDEPVDRSHPATAVQNASHGRKAASLATGARTSTTESMYAGSTVVVGRVVHGLNELRAFARGVRVSTRTLAPLQRIRVASKLVDGVHPTDEGSDVSADDVHDDENAKSGPMALQKRHRSGRRGSLSDDEEVSESDTNTDDLAEQRNRPVVCHRRVAKRARVEGSGNSATSHGSAARVHNVVLDQTSRLPVWTRQEAERATATARPVGAAAGAVGVAPAAAETAASVPFDFFQTQGQAFAHDIDSILGTQKMKKARHDRRAAKQRLYNTHTQSAASQATNTAATAAANSARMLNGHTSPHVHRRGKTTRKRY